jgi:hypothetical protein
MYTSADGSLLSFWNKLMDSIPYVGVVTGGFAVLGLIYKLGLFCKLRRHKRLNPKVTIKSTSVYFSTSFSFWGDD